MDSQNLKVTVLTGSSYTTKLEGSDKESDASFCDQQIKKCGTVKNMIADVELRGEEEPKATPLLVHSIKSADSDHKHAALSLFYYLTECIDPRTNEFSCFSGFILPLKKMSAEAVHSFLSESFLEFKKIVYSSSHTEHITHIVDCGKAIIDGIIKIDSFEEALFLRLKGINIELEKDEIWKLFIDGYSHDNGKYIFENEAGYLSGCYKAFILTLNLVKEKKEINSDLLELLHDTCVAEVWKLPFGSISQHWEPPAKFRLSYRDEENPHFSFYAPLRGKLSSKGVDELLKEAQVLLTEGDDYKKTTFLHCSGTFKLKIHFDQSMKAGSIKFLGCSSQKATIIKGYVEEILKKCYMSLNSCCPLYDKELAIANCIASLERIHPFYDGNCRTMTFILANALRIHIGLPPVIFSDPNDIDHLANSEIVDLMRQGQLMLPKVNT